MLYSSWDGSKELGSKGTFGQKILMRRVTSQDLGTFYIQIPVTTADAFTLSPQKSVRHFNFSPNGATVLDR